ncbi:MAG: FmdB family zinc ribbon protein [Betaproteobacteria bacterium]
MPIYAYKCDSCGFAKDVLQKISDAPLSDCPGCGKPEFKKQVTAAGFQLKGSGWYVTDFRGDKNTGAAKPETPGAAPVSGASAGTSASETATPVAAPEAAPATGASAAAGASPSAATPT